MDDAGGSALGICQQDAYCRKLTASVLSCTSLAPQKGGDAAKPTGSGVGCRAYEVVLDATPMFPESGGQPCDQGTLTVTSADGISRQAPVDVKSVAWREGVVYHMTDQEVPVGAQVEVEIDWERRYDHMQQHTGQHVVSAVADALLGASTTSWELHPADPSGVDSGAVAVDLSVTALTHQQLAAVEARANAEVRAMRAVRPLLLDPEADAEALQALVQGGGSGGAAAPFRGSLPASVKVKGPKLRLVQIEGLDVNACGGTHVSCTGELQLIKLLGVEKNRGMVRLRFVSGARALAALGRSLAREAGLTARLSCPPARHEEAVDALLRDKRDGSKARKLLAAELATLLGRALALAAQQPQPQPGNGRLPGPDGPDATAAAGPGSTASAAIADAAPQAPIAEAAGSGWALVHRPSADLDFLNAMAAAALEASPAGRAPLLLLTGDSTEPGAPPPSAKTLAGDSVDVMFLVAGQPDAVKACGAKVAEALGGRGGGRPGRYQGKAAGLRNLRAAQEAFAAAAAAL